MEDLAKPTSVRFFLLVDHIDQLVNGKLILVGVFDRYYVARNDGRLYINAGVLVAQMDSSLANGTEQRFTLECVNEDEDNIWTSPEIALLFHPTGDGRPWRGVLIARVTKTELPDFGSFEWRLRSGETLLGSCPFDVCPMPVE